MLEWYKKYRYFRILLQVMLLVIVVKLISDNYFIKKSTAADIQLSMIKTDITQVDITNSHNTFTLSKNENNWFINSNSISEKINISNVDSLLMILESLKSNKIISNSTTFDSKCVVLLLEKSGKSRELIFLNLKENYYLKNKNNTYSLLINDLSPLFHLKINQIRSPQVLKMKYESIDKIAFSSGKIPTYFYKNGSEWLLNEKLISNTFKQFFIKFSDLKSTAFYDSPIHDTLPPLYKLTFHDTNDSITLNFYKINENKVVMKSSQRLNTSFIVDSSLINECKFFEKQGNSKNDK
jgi:hypothetical protein